MSNINHPDHYNQGNVECIEAIMSALGLDGFRSFCQGNCLKYLWRYENKGGVEDLKKCQWYLKKLIDTYNNPQKIIDTIESDPQKSIYVSLVGKDGCIIEKGKTYKGEDGILWNIAGFTNDIKYPLIGYNEAKGKRWLKPSWLSSEFSTITASWPLDESVLNITYQNPALYKIIDAKNVNLSLTNAKDYEDYGYTFV